MRYVKRPIPVEAIQIPVKAPTAREYLVWSDNAPEWFHGRDIWMTEDGLIIPTLEGDMLCNWGSYIIQGVDGEIYPCHKDIFEKTYEPMEE